MNRMTLVVSLLLIYKYISEKSSLVAILTIGEVCFLPHRRARNKVDPTTWQSGATKKDPLLLKTCTTMDRK